MLAGRRHCFLFRASTSHSGPLCVRATRPAPFKSSVAAALQDPGGRRAPASSNHQPSPRRRARPCICACVTEREAPPNVAYVRWSGPLSLGFHCRPSLLAWVGPTLTPLAGCPPNASPPPSQSPGSGPPALGGRPRGTRVWVGGFKETLCFIPSCTLTRDLWARLSFHGVTGGAKH